MKKLYNRKKELCLQMMSVGGELVKLIVERFNFHYSETDNDDIIDTLDYGTSNLSYSEFIEIMNNYKKKRKQGDWEPNL